MRVRVRVLWVVLTASGAALLAAGAAGKPVQGQTLKIDLGSTVTTDPAYAQSTVDGQLQYATGLKLLNYPDREGKAGTKLVPEAASSYKISKDGKTYTFTIRNNFRFSDNKPVTAENFRRAIQRAQNPASPGARFASDVATVRAPNGSTLQFRLRAVAPDFLARMTMPFFSAIPTQTPDRQQTGPIPSAGPYFFHSFVPGGSLLLRENPFYRGSRSHRVPEIQLNLAIPPDRQLPRCQAGQTDVCSVPDSAVAGLAAQYGVNRERFFVKATLSAGFLFMNTSRPLFRDNAQLRRAINLAIDREAIVKGAFPAVGGRATDQLLPPGLPGFRDAKLYPLSGPDLTRARALAKGNTRGGKATLFTSSSAPSVATAQVVQSNLKQIGIDVGIKTFDPAVFATELRKPGAGYDLALSGWRAEYPDPYDFINILLQSKSIGTYNLSYFNNPAYDKKLAAAARLSGSKRLQTYGKLDADIMRNEAPLVPYVNPNARVLLSANVGCYTYNPMIGTDWAALCIK